MEVDLPVPASPNSRQLLALLTFHKCLCILDQLLLCHLIAHQIIQMYMCDLSDRHDLCTIFCMFNTECFVQSQFTHTEFFIKLGNNCFKFLAYSLTLPDVIAQITDTVTDSLVKYAAMSAVCFIIPSA